MNMILIGRCWPSNSYRIIYPGRLSIIALIDIRPLRKIDLVRARRFLRSLKLSRLFLASKSVEIAIGFRPFSK